MDGFYTGQSPDVHSPKGRNPRPMSPPHRPGSRLGEVGVDGACVRSCPRGGRTPSPLRALSADWLSRDAATSFFIIFIFSFSFFNKTSSSEG